MSTMKTNSNTYTMIYASVLVVIVAFLLAFVSSSLKDKQNSNVQLDTKKQILSALNVTYQDAEQAYGQYIQSDMLLKDGDLKPYEGAFVTSFEKDAKDNGNYHVFVASVDGQQKYIFPVYGAGLWGSIWGYIALNADKNTVYGTYFSHASETPGLGAEIATDEFQSRFNGKTLMEGGKIALSVVKNGQAKGAQNLVDGISGGTMTSNGVHDMIQKCLTNYVSFLNK